MKPLTKKEMEKIFQEIESLKTIHPKGEPLKLNDREQEEWNQHGQVFVDWDDGTCSYIMSQKRKAEFSEYLKGIRDGHTPG
jgi:hypothetical protein